VTGESLSAAATRLHEATGMTAGNGSLTRTAPVALAYLNDPQALVRAAHDVSSLTHHDSEAGEACALWCLAIRHAVLHGTLDGLRLAVPDLPTARARVWSTRLVKAEAGPPSTFDRNGWVVQALQGAWSAITRTPIPARSPERHLQLALEAAVRGGGDTDTVAAIAGGLLGARWGAGAIPEGWIYLLYGWPNMNATDLSTRPSASPALTDSHGAQIDHSNAFCVRRTGPCAGMRLPAATSGLARRRCQRGCRRNCSNHRSQDDESR